MASASAPEAQGGCILRKCSCRFRIHQRKQGSRRSEGAKTHIRKHQSAVLQSAIRSILLPAFKQSKSSTWTRPKL
eukprot:882565-Alexandrium_andersonii.AAC.1